MKTKKKKSKEIQVGKEFTDAARKSSRFYTTPAQSGKPIFYFREPDDYIKGQLIGTSVADYQYYSSKTYQIKVWEMVQEGKIVPVENDQVIDIVAYRDLKRIIEKCELMGSIVKIIMIGKLRTHAGHFRFAWEVYKDTGTFSAHEIKQAAKPKRKYKKRKVKKHGSRK